ncbi:transcriptional regulator with XRE-family HTH domain [Mycoplana sp. BE70]|uniref:helix-turn-helix domain-containing protein n=1 Tax=Mycoplana sp. BE70 TaxID=2817775 RepID=UPI00285DDE07|nr:helix-turn-helix transcriptional regulator [Mycoplana sp. BE70]MDR6758714.1 transcriptional regulator with XRE-family HTH domain [Mycoplana sp. BE70]
MAQRTTAQALASSSTISDAAKLHPVDREVGNRIRVRRLQLRMSQAALGAGIGVSFQQIQKYESGVNRVSSSVLYAIADVLDVPMTHFFEKLPRPGKGNTKGIIQRADVRQDFVATTEGQRLVDAFLALPQKTRSKFVALIEVFGRNDL